jgi:hypothetical protein
MQSFQPPCPQENFKYEVEKHIFFYSCQFFFEGHHLKMGPSLQCYSGVAHLHVTAGGQASRYEG